MTGTSPHPQSLSLIHISIRRGGDLLKQGGLVAFPTETVYGLGGDALNPQASMKIYAAKGRPSDNPLIVHIAEFDKLAPIVAEVPEKAKILAEKYWPGPLTMILPKSDLVPQETTGGLDLSLIHILFAGFEDKGWMFSKVLAITVTGFLTRCV